MKSEEEIMVTQTNVVVTTYNNVPYGIIADDVSEISKEGYFQEMNEINELYRKYANGVDFVTEGSGGDYIPSKTKYKKAAQILNKEARFLFSTPPDFNINANDVERGKMEDNAVLQELVKKVLKRSGFSDSIAKACKDCFIGKRVAAVVNFNESNGIKVSFINSLNFIYDVDPEDSNVITKFIFFTCTTDTINRTDQRYFKKTYDIEDGYCYIREDIYNGLGDLLETQMERTKTELTFIPCYIIRNDGLTGDLKGSSELTNLIEHEGDYSKLSNADKDAERKSMNPTKYTIDASEGSTKGLSSSPGSYWDLQSDDTHESEKTARVGIIESTMAYSGALKVTLDRIENTMYNEVDVPNVNSEKLQGLITSGKTISALYWGLTVRCDEKMLTWAPALEFVARVIIEGAKVYPEISKKYVEDPIPDIDYEVDVVNNYALPEDVKEEKDIDISEIIAQTMSRKTYLKKWRKMTDEEAEEELMQIKKEKDLFENAAIPYDMDTNVVDEEDLGDEEDEGDLEDEEIDTSFLDEDDGEDIDEMLDSFLSELEGM